MPTLKPIVLCCFALLSACSAVRTEHFTFTWTPEGAEPRTFEASIERPTKPNAQRVMLVGGGSITDIDWTTPGSFTDPNSGETTQFTIDGEPTKDAMRIARRLLREGYTVWRWSSIYTDDPLHAKDPAMAQYQRFNTTIDMGLPGGATAVSGEISMRKDQPFAREDGDALSGAVGLPALGCDDAPTPYDCYTKFESGDYNPGFVQTDYYQAELVFIHFFDQILGASRWTAILDIAGSYIDMPSKSQALLNSAYNATLNHPYAPNVPTILDNTITPPGFPLIATPYPQFLQDAWEASVAGGTPLLTVAPESNYFPTSGAWGYKLRFAGEYNNVVGGLNLRPVISFSHDVYGTTPSPIANFLEDRKALGLSLEGIILNDYSVKFSYTDFYGAEPYNSLHDRDYYSLSATASF